MQAGGLTASEIFCRRGDRLLFGSLDLRLEAGQALHLVGPNGIGKTSLLRILARLVPPSPTGLPSPLPRIGSVHWTGTVAYLDGRPALDEHLTLRRALAFWQAVDGDFTVSLDELGLADLTDVPVRYLSTGQRKRASLARLIGQNGDHWLLDEPLNGLDDAGVRIVERLIAEKRASGGVVVVASHQPIGLAQARVLDLREHPA